jgi:small subunit ribosomal protein S21
LQASGSLYEGAFSGEFVALLNPWTSALPPEGGEFLLAEVHIQDGETLESALRRFKRKVQQEDIIKEIKRHSFYLKPGEKKRTKEALARKRNRKKRSKDVE